MGLYESLEQQLERVSVGDYQAKKRVASIIKEADELMEEMAEALECYVDDMYIQMPAKESLKRYKTWKDQTK